MQPTGKLLSIAANAKTKVYSKSSALLLWVTFMGLGVLAGCSATSEKAPITDLSVTVEEPPAEIQQQLHKHYTVERGDTLYKIAREHNISVQELAQVNNIIDPSQLKVGQRLNIPGADAAVVAQTDIASSSQVVAAPVDIPQEASKPKPDKSKNESSEIKEKPKESSASPRASDANLINWGWPNKGKIIQNFSPSTKGIDIEGQVGDPVLAAADGKVMYAGNGVRGLGNLILLGHSDGFITAYAHNDSLLVKTGEEVKKGQKVATLGQSEANSPRLHFEIRRRGTPVNPMSYLPKR